mmetsp:Transcript_155828/g.499579  ORF Transcript_155828/g.499579 Transcript_155828/m.499579 type:complete len:525 (+) Transcript_155828:2244-3818(+)
MKITSRTSCQARPRPRQSAAVAIRARASRRETCVDVGLKVSATRSPGAGRKKTRPPEPLDETPAGGPPLLRAAMPRASALAARAAAPHRLEDGSPAGRPLLAELGPDKFSFVAMSAQDLSSTKRLKLCSSCFRRAAKSKSSRSTACSFASCMSRKRIRASWAPIASSWPQLLLDPSTGLSDCCAFEAVEEAKPPVLDEPAKLETPPPSKAPGAKERALSRATSNASATGDHMWPFRLSRGPLEASSDLSLAELGANVRDEARFAVAGGTSLTTSATSSTAPRPAPLPELSVPSCGRDWACVSTTVSESAAGGKPSSANLTEERARSPERSCRPSPTTSMPPPLCRTSRGFREDIETDSTLADRPHALPAAAAGCGERAKYVADEEAEGESPAVPISEMGSIEALLREGRFISSVWCEARTPFFLGARPAPFGAAAAAAAATKRSGKTSTRLMSGLCGGPPPAAGFGGAFCTASRKFRSGGCRPRDAAAPCARPASAICPISRSKYSSSHSASSLGLRGLASHCC